LRASLDLIHQRTRHDRNRPLLQGQDRRQVLDRLLRERDPLYREVADLVIETEHRPQRDVIRIILARMPLPARPDAEDPRAKAQRREGNIMDD